MTRFLKTIAFKIIFHLRGAERADTLIVSYPKSGRTWLRVLLGKYLALKYGVPEADMLKTRKITKKCGLAPVDFTHDGSAMLEGTPASRMNKCRRKYSRKRVLLLGRDVKDTLVSAYFQATKRIKVFQGDISEFIRSERYGAGKIASFYAIWQNQKHLPADFAFIRYEDLHRDTADCLSRVLSFIGEEEIDQEAVSESVKYSNFKNLKKLEAKGEFRQESLSAGNSSDPDSYKVRKGEIGGYNQYLSDDDIRFIDQVAGDPLDGFEPNNNRMA